MVTTLEECEEIVRLTMEKRAHCIDMTGMIDSTPQSWGGVTTFSHPTIPHSPTPWYIYKDKDFTFNNAALLFDQPLKIEANYFQLVYIRSRIGKRLKGKTIG